MREALQAYVKPAGERTEPVHGNEPAIRPIPVGPLFTIPVDDRTGPPECLSEERVDFRPTRSVKPADRKPAVANAIDGLVRQRTLTAVLDNADRSEPRTGGEAAGRSKQSTRNSSYVRGRLSRGRPSGR
jgi:hypothetical protein